MTMDKIYLEIKNQKNLSRVILFVLIMIDFNVKCLKYLPKNK